MLRIIPQTSAAKARSYYSKSDYFTEGQELAGVWGGRGAERLGLRGLAEKSDFDALCENRNPATGDPLTARTKAERRVLYDWNFHVPKSVSLAYELTGDERILDAFRVSVDETMQEAETEMKTRVRVKGESSDRVTRNMVWASFVHRTSRPSKEDKLPDPHLHAHVCVFNATFDPAEGRWKAGQFGDLKRDSPYWEAGFHARFAHRLADLGYGVTRTTKGWELAGVSAGLVRKFSRRTVEIEKLAADLKITDPKVKDKLGATSRLNKCDWSMADLRAYWQGRLTPAEKAALVTVADRARDGIPVLAALSDQEAMAHAVLHAFERESVVSDKRLYADALKFGVGGATVDGVRKEAKRQGVLTTELDGRTVATTREVLAEEKRLLDFARRGRGTCRPLAPDHTLKREYLADDQRRAVHHLLESSDRVMLVRGAAGVGKTELSKEAVAAIQSTGRAVAVLAPSAKASRGVLRDEGFADADTVAAYLRKPEFRESARDGVIWVDESGQLGVRDLARVFDAANELDARVVLVGDSMQHGSVARGPALKLLETHAGLPCAQVTDIRRQRGEYKQAVELLSRGRAAEGFDKLDALGWIREVGDEVRAKEVAMAYQDAKENKESVLVVSPTHAEAAGITAAIREIRKERGELGEEREFLRLVPANLTEAQRADPLSYLPGDVIQYHQAAKGVRAGERVVVAEGDTLPLAYAPKFQVYHAETQRLAVGDVVRVTANGKTRDRKHDLTNGASFTVKSFTPAGDLVTDKGWVIDRSFGHLTHGYVTTSHAAQGATVDRVLVAQSAVSLPASTREQFYVSCSRGRKGVTVFTDSKADLKEAVERSDPRVSATDAFTHPKPSAIKSLARRVAFVQRWASVVKARVEAWVHDRAAAAVRNFDREAG